ncbi:MAG: NYN domain-containing protein [Pirellulales bacterium]|nr:NYN domain-containing protein [Pirellulales bacterium]
MALLIDGYNLLNVAGIVAPRRGPGTLARARLALLNFLAESLDEKEIERTTVVFDAADTPPGLPRQVTHRGLRVHFASGYPDADSLLEELIEEDSAPRRLTVVSSDHRVQRAARRRRAKPIDADVWYSAVVRRRQRRIERDRATAPARPPVPLLAEDVAYWVRQFGGQSVFDALIREEDAAGMSRPNPTEVPSTGDEDADKPRNPPDGDLLNPFPPGYAEDLGPL